MARRRLDSRRAATSCVAEFRDHDAERLFEVEGIETQESSVCISGLVLQGVKKPHDCPAFGKECTPQHPLGATMVSAEGACAAYYAYGRHLEAGPRAATESEPACTGRYGVSSLTPWPCLCRAMLCWTD